MIVAVLNNEQYALNLPVIGPFRDSSYNECAKFADNRITTRNTYKATKALYGCVKRFAKY
jgi:hypothetical protein